MTERVIAHAALLAALLLTGCHSPTLGQNGGVEQLEQLCERQPESQLCQEN